MPKKKKQQQQRNYQDPFAPFVPAPSTTSTTSTTSPPTTAPLLDLWGAINRPVTNDLLAGVFNAPTTTIPSAPMSARPAGHQAYQGPARGIYAPPPPLPFRPAGHQAARTRGVYQAPWLDWPSEYAPNATAPIATVAPAPLTPSRPSGHQASRNLSVYQPSPTAPSAPPLATSTKLADLFPRSGPATSYTAPPASATSTSTSTSEPAPPRELSPVERERAAQQAWIDTLVSQSDLSPDIERRVRAMYSSALTQVPGNSDNEITAPNAERDKALASLHEQLSTIAQVNAGTGGEAAAAATAADSAGAGSQLTPDQQMAMVKLVMDYIEPTLKNLPKSQQDAGRRMAAALPAYMAMQNQARLMLSRQGAGQAQPTTFENPYASPSYINARGKGQDQQQVDPLTAALGG